MTQPSLETDPLAPLLARAEATLISKRTIASLGNAAPPEQLTAALERALTNGRIHASTVLALAIGTAGGRIPAGLANQLIPDLESIEHLSVIAGIVEGDRLGALLDLVAEEQVGWERAAVALFLATQLLDGAEPPPRLVAQLRSLAREPLSLQAGMIAGLAARTLKNSEIDTLTTRFADVAVLAEFNGLDQKIRDGFFKPVLDSLPEESGGRLVSGYTVVRTEPKVGRNDPCPCGSGRKYKKCCAAREQEPAVEPSRVEQFQKLAGHGARAQDRLFDELRPAELVQVDPATLTTIQLILGARKLTIHHRWEAAERFLDVLSTRTDVPHGDPHGYRVELADEARRAGLLDFAEKQMKLSGRSESERRRFDMRIALARNAPDALTQLEVLALEGHQGNHVLLADVGFALLDHFPALGILAARGSLNAEHLLDSETLLDFIGHARDRLGLSATDPWEEIFESWLDGGDYSWIPKPRRGRDDEESTRDDEIARLQTDLREATTRVSRLDAELTKRMQQLDDLTAEREKPVVIANASLSIDERRRVAELEGERQRLRLKITELKGEVTEGAAQRAELRRELARAADAQRRQPSTSTPADQEDHDHDEAEGDAVGERPRKILAPQFSPAASRALGTLPARVATEALLETARLAGGDAHAWSGTKHMRRSHEILSARIGRTYRLLFRIEGERLEVLDLIHRRDLDNAIARLA